MYSVAISCTFIVLSLFGGVHGQSGNGVTTRYWDCCKPSCGWPNKANVHAPVRSCDKRNNPLADHNTQSGCTGGGAFACSSNVIINHVILRQLRLTSKLGLKTPWAVNDNLSYGFAAVRIRGSSEASWCCQCYELTFTNGPAAGKKMIVQATNTGGDLGNNHFDLMIPGGGVGAFGGGCAAQYSVPLTGWGARYGGVSK
ncbi:putative effector protein/endoglucanase [Ceratobasidium theobromae]|uniref:Cellulase n=1 Tax=Ceratobasidium theobromae TaxID=1582974 RepID=A0A5N5QE16_9AGAM|nr:putative effector protein/endoglucanase [Ceratobasidium theobromae]